MAPVVARDTIFRFELNLRESLILGIVGAGGIGLQLQASLNVLAWSQVTMIFIVILATVVLRLALEVGTAEDEITVTATRRAEKAGDISAALTVIGSEDIVGEKLITDALAAEPGLFLQQTTPGQGAAIIRGLKGSSILHLVDGLRLNNAIFRSAPTQYFALVPTGAVEPRSS